MLRGGNLVMLGLGVNAELPQLYVKVVHKFRNTGAQRAEIVILHFLPFRRLGAKKGSPCDN